MTLRRLACLPVHTAVNSKLRCGAATSELRIDSSQPAGIKVPVLAASLGLMYSLLRIGYFLVRYCVSAVFRVWTALCQSHDSLAAFNVSAGLQHRGPHGTSPLLPGLHSGPAGADHRSWCHRRAADMGARRHTGSWATDQCVMPHGEGAWRCPLCSQLCSQGVGRHPGSWAAGLRVSHLGADVCRCAAHQGAESSVAAVQQGVCQACCR